jgi:hypothetical protein
LPDLIAIRADAFVGDYWSGDLPNLLLTGLSHSPAREKFQIISWRQRVGEAARSRVVKIPNKL